MHSFFVSCLLILLAFAPCPTYAQLQCEDIESILKTQIEIRRLQSKYESYLRTKYNWSCHDYFYGAFIEDDYETIFNCLLQGDTRIVSLYVDYILSDKGSADEAMVGYLGMLYMKRKDAILSTLKSYPIEDADYIIHMLKYDSFFVAPAGTMNVDIHAIQHELDEFSDTLHRQP